MIGEPFQVHLPLLHFRTKPLRPCPGAPTAYIPPGKPCPFLHPESLARVGTSCSPELSDLSGSPSIECQAQSFYLSAFPSHPWFPVTLQYPCPWVSGSLPFDGLALSLYGRRPVWPFRSRTVCHPFEKSNRRGLFFPLEALSPLQSRSHFSLRLLASLLTGGGTLPRSPT